MLSTGIGDILRIVELLRNGKDSRKVKVDDVKVQKEAHIKATDAQTVKITANLPFDGSDADLVAIQHIDGDRAEITLGGTGVTNEDIDLNLIFHGLSVDIKATLTFTHNDHNHKVEIYFGVGL